MSEVPLYPNSKKKYYKNGRVMYVCTPFLTIVGIWALRAPKRAPKGARIRIARSRCIHQGASVTASTLCNSVPFGALLELLAQRPDTHTNPTLQLTIHVQCIGLKSTPTPLERKTRSPHRHPMALRGNLAHKKQRLPRTLQ